MEENQVTQLQDEVKAKDSEIAQLKAQLSRVPSEEYIKGLEAGIDKMGEALAMAGVEIKKAKGCTAYWVKCWEESYGGWTKSYELEKELEKHKRTINSQIFQAESLRETIEELHKKPRKQSKKEQTEKQRVEAIRQQRWDDYHYNMGPHPSTYEDFEFV